MRLFGQLCCVLFGVATAGAADPRPAQSPPNIIIILADDLGYGDLGCYGAKQIRTPNIDRIAREGVRLTSFYVSQAVCTASRASLMTGCYANRVGLEGALNPTSKVGINADELLLSEMCKKCNYHTALFGKWHLGHQSEFNPLRHGFDNYFGLPYPNDCSNQYHPIVRTFPPLPLMDGEKVVATDPDQSQFTRQFTERSVKFIEQHKDRPFFLYLAHVMPHVPIFASDRFRGKSAGGLYGDVVEELDWSVGEIMSTLKRLGIDDRTLVIFSSDNGPFLSYGSHAGSSGPLRGGKLTAFEGGVRMPGIARWPGKIPAGRTSDEIVTTMDILPTVTKLIGGELSKHSIDGRDAWPVLSGQPGAKSSHAAFFFYADSELHAVRSGDWKLHLPHRYLEVVGEPGRDGKPSNFHNLKPDSLTKSGLEGIATRHGYRVEQLDLALYNLRDDIAETTNVADQNPDVVQRLLKLADEARSDLGDSLTGQRGRGVRPPGRL
jgi:arylsulfatase